MKRAHNQASSSVSDFADDLNLPLEDEDEDEIGSQEDEEETESDTGRGLNPEEYDDLKLEDTPQGAELRLLKREMNDEDSSDDDIPNTIGNVPPEWYEGLDHVGYDLDGEPIPKDKGMQAEGDSVSQFLARKDDPNYWRTVYDELRGRSVKLSDEDLRLINTFISGSFPENYNPYEEWTESPLANAIHPIISPTPPKRSFLPSKSERDKVAKIALAIRRGWIKPGKAKKQTRFYDLWEKEMDVNRPSPYLPPPRRRMPGHELSYNPPEEYLPTEEDLEKWKKDPESAPKGPFSKQYNSMRTVPQYDKAVVDAFDRCLDLYMCPREARPRPEKSKRIHSLQELLPKLPHPTELKPFPSHSVVSFTGHTAAITSISVHPTGEWLASAALDHTLRIWEVETGRCCRQIRFTGDVRMLQWNPNPAVFVLAVALEQSVLFISSGALPCPPNKNKEKEEQIPEPPLEPASEGAEPVPLGNAVWEEGEALSGKGTQGIIALRVRHSKDVHRIAWHGKGDYLAAVSPNAGKSAVVIHQVSKRQSQNPFRPAGGKAKGQANSVILDVVFHPSKPRIFVATQRVIRIYDLVKQELITKIFTPSSGVSLSSIAIHRSGDHVLIGSLNKRVSWYDLDLSVKRPYKLMHVHTEAVRRVAFHPSYPLFASCSDDRTVQVYHGTVYADLLQNPLIVPLITLRGHSRVKEEQPPEDEPVDSLVGLGGTGSGIVDIAFHPVQPWLFSAGADGIILLHTDCL